MDILYLDKNKLKQGSLKELTKLKNKKVWIDISNISKGEADSLAKIFKLHPVTRDDILRVQGRVKIEQFPNYIFCTFYTLQRKPRKGIKLVALEYILGKNFLITAHRKPIEEYERLKEQDYRLTRLLKEGVESVFHKLLDQQIDEFFPVLEEIDDQIELLDRKITESTDRKILSNILEVKKDVSEIKKISIPQREKLSSLTKRQFRFIPEKSKPYFRDIYDESVRVCDLVDNFREAITSTFDAYMTNIANRSNEVMKVLSVIATIALPLTVVSSVYGTNFLHIPGLNSVNGFWAMILTMGLMTSGMIFYFKKRNW